MLVAQNIEALMRARKTDAAKLARAAKLNPTGIYDILSGKSRSPTIETIGKIADALGVPTSTMFEEVALSDLRTDMLHLFESLPDPERQLLLRTARAWLSDRQTA